MKNNKKYSNIDTGPYDFISKDINVQSLIHLMNLHLPKDFIAVEIGVWYAQATCMIAQNCTNIKKIYGIDPYVPYEKILDNSTVGEKEINFAKNLAKHNIEFSGVKDKIELLELDSTSALNKFDDKSIDFIFIDCPKEYDEQINDLSEWYKKIKSGGIISGHDWSVISKSIVDFKNNIKDHNLISIIDDVWVWIKK
jgi:SAM-dependent methyltransferase